MRVAAVIDLHSRQSGRLEHGIPYADQPSGRCAAHGVVPAAVDTT